MPTFRRAYQPGGKFFFTHVTYRRRYIFTDALARSCLHDSISVARSKRPFEMNAVVLLPDHLHCIMTLPDRDHDFAARWRSIKAGFSRLYLERRPHLSNRGVSDGMANEDRQPIWQRRYWERTIRNEEEYYRLCDYIHYNPVKHGHAQCPHEWEWSSFRRFVANRFYEPNWGCVCKQRACGYQEPEGLSELVGE